MAKGSTTIKTRMAQEFAMRVLDSEGYRRSLELRANSGTLPPAVETMLWHYAYGKPVETIHLTTPLEGTDLTELSDEEIAALARDRARVVVAALATGEDGKAIEGEVLPVPRGQSIQ